MEEQKKGNIPIIDYQQLLDDEDISAEIQAGFGQKGHGVILVKNIKGYLEARLAALPLINELANLPEPILKNLEKQQIFYSRGWSKGKEKFMGKPDNAKASFYFNPVIDGVYQIPPGSEDQFNNFQKELYSKSENIWPREVPELQSKFKSLSKIMIKTGVLLAKQIDKFAKKEIPTYTNGHLENTIAKGTFHFARLLHYFPKDKVKGEVDELCGWHNDHGALTALTSAMFIDKDGNIVENPPSTGGLYAQNRFTQQVRIKIPADMLAFQLGQSTQIYTGGKLEATPHAVKSPNDPQSIKYSRNTFAIFMQADPLGRMSVPPGMNAEEASVIPSENLSPLIDRWARNGMYFKEFHANTLNYYYPSTE